MTAGAQKNIGIDEHKNIIMEWHIFSYELCRGLGWHN
jgi:hypothetical protein